MVMQLDAEEHCLWIKAALTWLGLFFTLFPDYREHSVQGDRVAKRRAVDGDLLLDFNINGHYSSYTRDALMLRWQEQKSGLPCRLDFGISAKKNFCHTYPALDR